MADDHYARFTKSIPPSKEPRSRLSLAPVGRAHRALHTRFLLSPPENASNLRLGAAREDLQDASQ